MGVVQGLGGEVVDGREGLIQKTYFPVYILYLPPYSPPRHPLSKGNDLAETLLFRGTLRLEPGAGQKWGVMIKVFATRSQKWSLWLIGSFQEQLRYLLCQIEGYKR